jgi:hypothetical protein
MMPTRLEAEGPPYAYVGGGHEHSCERSIAESDRAQSDHTAEDYLVESVCGLC